MPINTSPLLNAVWGERHQPPAWTFWDGKPLDGDVIGFDTETEAETDLTTGIPRLALAVASNGQRTVIIEPLLVDEFLEAHREKTWAGFNWGFDWWTVEAVLDHPVDRLNWKDMVSAGQLTDLMLLDTLIRLATDPVVPELFHRNLDLVAKDYLGIEVPKDNPYRLRFGELIGADWNDPKWKPWFDYASRDAWATYRLEGPLRRRALGVMCEHWPQKEVQELWDRYGLLSESIQTKASIVLSWITRNGFKVDRPRVQEMIRDTKELIEKITVGFRQSHPRVFNEYKIKAKAGTLKMVKGTDVPKLNQSGLLGYLEEVVRDRKLTDMPRSAVKRQLTMTWETWEQRAGDHPFIREWVAYEKAKKELQWLTSVDVDMVHPRYDVLKRTGRTGSRNPNIQNVRRESGYRSLFVARPGHKLVIVDYAYIELRTLAHVLVKMFGKSRLAEVIKAGLDPHEAGAAEMVGVSLEEFRSWKKDPEKAKDYKKFRQAQKAVNFGTPGGLGPHRLRDYARSNYGVEMDLGEAMGFRAKLINETFPELAQYLEDREGGMKALARNLGVNELGCWVHLDFTGERPDWLPHVIQKVVRGDTIKSDGESYSPRFLNGVWEGLNKLVGPKTDPKVSRLIRQRRAGGELYNRLFSSPSTTVTGRIRSGCDYGERLNNRFQGLASDGFKVALWNLFLAGYRIVAPVHDEVVAEVPEDRAEECRLEIERIMVESMESVLDNQIPVAVESLVSDKWAKG